MVHMEGSLWYWYCPKHSTPSHFNLFHSKDELRIAVTDCIRPNLINNIANIRARVSYGEIHQCNALTNSRLSNYLQAHKNQEWKSNCFQNEECISFNKTKHYEPNRSLFAVCVVLKTCPDFSKPLPFGKTEKSVYTGPLKSCCQYLKQDGQRIFFSAEHITWMQIHVRRESSERTVRIFCC